jgi:soluble cytochrome b562
MSKLINLGVAAIFAFMATLPIAAYAQDDSEVSSNFKQMGRTMRSLTSLEGQELADAMIGIRQYLVANAELVPSMLEGKSAEEIAEFQDGINYALGMYDSAIGLAEAGHNGGAQTVIAQLGDFRGDMHEKYGVGD